MSVPMVFVPSAPLLLPTINPEPTPAQAELRAAAVAAAGHLRDTAEVIVLAAPTPVVDGGRPAEGWTAVDLPATWDAARLGLTGEPQVTPPAPVGLAIASWLLQELEVSDVHSYLISGGRRAVVNGAAAVQLPSSAGVLVVADGSAGRHEKAPGHVRAGAVEADDAVAGALAAGDAEALLGLPDAWDADLLCAGRPVWQAAARLVIDHGHVQRSTLDYYDAPHHVGSFVAHWSVSERR